MCQRVPHSVVGVVSMVVQSECGPLMGVSETSYCGKVICNSVYVDLFI